MQSSAAWSELSLIIPTIGIDDHQPLPPVINMPSIKIIREEAEHRIKQLEKEEHAEHEYKRYAIATSMKEFASDIVKNRDFSPEDMVERHGQLMKEMKYAQSYCEKKLEDLKDKKQKVYADARDKIEGLRDNIRSELKLEEDNKVRVGEMLDYQKSMTKELEELLAREKKREHDMEYLDHVNKESIGNVSRKRMRIEKDIAALPPPFRRFGIAPKLPPPPPPPPFRPPPSMGMM